MSEEKQYTLQELKKELNEKQKIFCAEYVVEWNATKSYLKAYPNEKTDNTAAVNGNRLLRNAKISQYIEYIKTDYEFLCGISKTKQLNELYKIAYSSIRHLHNNWIKLKDWDDIIKNDPDALDAVESTETKTETRNIEGKNDVKVEFIKLKLYSKQAAIAEINKMMGYNEPEKSEISGGIKLITHEGDSEL